MLDAIYTTGSELVVGRTVGEIAIAGRSILNVVVGGNLNEFDNNPPRDVLRYDEREVTANISFDSDVEAVVAAYSGGGYGLFTPVFGNGTFRNDSILSAEFVSNSASAVEILGELGGGDPINTFEDRADVYAFAADGSQPIIVENFLGGALMQVRIVDQDGRTLAANEFPVTGEEDLSDFVRLTFTPDMPGIYYLVVQGDPNITTDGNAGSTFGYLTTISGMAAVSLGAYRTAGSSGAASEPDAVNTVAVLSGAVGSLRIGTGYTASAGGETTPLSIINTEEEEPDNLMDFRGGTFSFPGNLYNITTGSDFGEANFFEPINIFIGGNLGTIVTGLSPLVGQSPFQGDLGVVNLQVNGSIAMLDIRGGIGVDQDVEDPETNITLLPEDSTNIAVGLDADGPVEIGMIRVGSRVYGPAFNLTAPGGTIIGGFLVDQDTGIDPATQDDTGIISLPPDFLTGSGSDIRFVHFNQIDGRDRRRGDAVRAGQPGRVHRRRRRSRADLHRRRQRQRQQPRPRAARRPVRGRRDRRDRGRPDRRRRAQHHGPGQPGLHRRHLDRQDPDHRRCQQLGDQHHRAVRDRHLDDRAAGRRRVQQHHQPDARRRHRRGRRHRPQQHRHHRRPAGSHPAALLGPEPDRSVPRHRGRRRRRRRRHHRHRRRHRRQLGAAAPTDPSTTWPRAPCTWTTSARPSIPTSPASSSAPATCSSCRSATRSAT